MKDYKQSDQEQPLISVTEALLSSQRKALGQYKIRKALVSFIPVGGMADRFCQQNGKQVLLSRYWDSWVREDGTVLVGPIFGGPMCSVVLEELAALGVQHFIGYGYSGSLESEVPPASIIVARSTFCSDGTSKEYCDDDEVRADESMLEQLHATIKKRDMKSVIGKVWTTDAMYREFPSKVAFWQGRGAGFVNLETASLYAVAKAKGLQAVYLSVVSDNVAGAKWSGWFADYEQAQENMWGICLDMLETL